MRRLSFIALVCFLAAVPAALASGTAAGDGVLELKGVNGNAVIGTAANFAHGAVWGQLDSGTLAVLDPYANDGKLFVSGWDKKPVVRDTLDGRLSVYSGKNLRFRITGGSYRLVVNSGVGLDLTAVGVGIAYLNGDVKYDDDGSYAVDDGKWQPVLPVLSLTTTRPAGFAVPFGTQPTLSQP